MCGSRFFTKQRPGIGALSNSGSIFYKPTPCARALVRAPKHMSLANESKPGCRPGGQYVDLLRSCNKAPATPPWVFVIVRLFYHIFRAKSRLTFRNSWLPYQGSWREAPERFCGGRNLSVTAYAVPPLLVGEASAHSSVSGFSAAAASSAASMAASCSAVGSSPSSASTVSVCASSSWSVRASTITLSFSPRRITRTPEP